MWKENETVIVTSMSRNVKYKCRVKKAITKNQLYFGELQKRAYLECDKNLPDGCFLIHVYSRTRRKLQ